MKTRKQKVRFLPFLLCWQFWFSVLLKNEKKSIKQQYPKNKVFPQTQCLSGITKNLEKIFTRLHLIFTWIVHLPCSLFHHGQVSTYSVELKVLKENQLFHWRGARDFMQNIFQKLGSTCSLIQEGGSIGARGGALCCVITSL